MKKFLIICVLVALAGTGFAQTPRAKKSSFTTTATKNASKKPATPPPVYKDNVQGAIPRAVRGGNPLQMLNPRAPAKYGTSADSVILDPDTGKWRGIKLFEILF
jgi:hypothetical protein